MRASSTDGATGAPLSPFAPLAAGARPPPLQCRPSDAVLAVMAQLDATRADAIVVVDPDTGVPLGIVTLRDILKRVAMAGVDIAAPVATIMTGGLITLPVETTAHQASVVMLRRGVRHLVLVDARGALAALVSQADLFVGAGGTSADLVARIGAAGGIATLVDVAGEVHRFSRQLLDQGLSPAAMQHRVSSLDDLIALRAIDLVAERHELPYVPWCWLAFGSEGRFERTLSTDQDNGLIFLAASDAEADALRAAFLPFAREVNRVLDACGFRLCRGNVMAGNPQLCLSLDEWQRKFGEWLETTDPQAILNATIFFDFRPLCGDERLAAVLRQWLLSRTPQAGRLLRAMVEGTLNWPSPLGWLSSFRCDDDPEFPHSIDLKLHGVRPFVDAARIWALAHGVAATNTAERLRGVASRLNLSGQDIAAFVAAMDHVQRLRFDRQLTCDDDRGANRVDPDQLNALDREVLKESFRQAKRIQQLLEIEFLRS